MINHVLNSRKYLSTCVALVLVAILLAGCNAASLQLANGVGGTGITMGRVTGFGSIIVNGVNYNTDNATFTRDGIGSKQQTDFSTGELVTITGSIDSNKKTGVATQVSFSDALEGTVTSIASGQSIHILGQKVTTNSLTIFHGFDKLSDLKIGNITEVSGFVNNGEITASSIKLIGENYIAGSLQEVEGYISNLNTTLQSFNINDQIIDYSSAQFSGFNESNLMNGQYLIVSSESNVSNNTLLASKVELFNDDLEPDTFYEIEGYVTQFQSVTNFEIDGVPVAVNDDTLFNNSSIAKLDLDKHIIVNGTVNNQNVLIADDITILDDAPLVIIEANIESIDLNADKLTILGQTIQITNFTLLSDDTSEDFLFLNLNDFSVGDSVYISARQSNNGITAERLSKIDLIPTFLLSGLVSDINSSTQSFTVFDNGILTDENTEYFDKNSNPISSTSFFSELTDNQNMIQIFGNLTDSNEILSTELFLVDIED